MSAHSKESVFKKLSQINNFNTIPIHFKSTYGAVDGICKFLTQLVYSPKAYLPPQQHTPDMPLYVLYPSDSYKLRDINDYSPPNHYGIGLYTFVANNDDSVLSALTFLKNGPDGVCKYVHLLKIKNSQILQKQSPTSLKTLHHFSLCNNEQTCFSKDEELVVFHPILGSATDQVNLLKTRIDNFRDLFERQSLQTLLSKVLMKKDDIRDLEKKLKDVGEVVKYEAETIDGRLFWDEGMTDDDFLQMKDTVIWNCSKEKIEAMETARVMADDIILFIETRRSLKEAKNALHLTLLDVVAALEKVEREQSSEMTVGEKASFKGAISLAKKVVAIDIFGEVNKIEEEAEFEQVATFEMVYDNDAKYYVSTVVEPVKEDGLLIEFD